MNVYTPAIVSAIDSSVRGLIPAVVAIVFLLARRFLPPAPTVVVSAEEAKKFPKLWWKVGGSVIAVGLCLGFCAYETLIWLNRLLAGEGQRAKFVLLPDPAIWGAIAGFGSLLVSWELTMRLWAIFGKRSRVKQYEVWSWNSAGFDGSRLWHALWRFLGVPLALCAILALPIHTTLRDTEMSVGGFGRFNPSPHRYSDVRKITVTRGIRTRSGGFLLRYAIILDFDDAYRWSSADNRAWEGTLDTDLLDFLQTRTGLQADFVEALPFGTN